MSPFHLLLQLLLSPIADQPFPPLLRVQTVFIGTIYDPSGAVAGHRVRTFIDVPEAVPDDEQLAWTKFGPYFDHYGSFLAEASTHDPRELVLVGPDRLCRVKTLRKVYIRADDARTAAIEVDAASCGPIDAYRFAVQVPP